jgi:hypothetical protein
MDALRETALSVASGSSKDTILNIIFLILNFETLNHNKSSVASKDLAMSINRQLSKFLVIFLEKTRKFPFHESLEPIQDQRSLISKTRRSHASNFLQPYTADYKFRPKAENTWKLSAVLLNEFLRLFKSVIGPPEAKKHSFEARNIQHGLVFRHGSYES